MRSAARSAVLTALLAACGVSPTPDHPVVLIGIDGLEPSLVARLLEEGRLPNLARFAAEGVVGRIDTMTPTYSPVIWTTIATGQLPDAHGIDFFHDGEGRPYTSNARAVPALWNLVSDAELTVDCIGWWNTWPAETIRGRMLASYAAQAQAELIWKPGVWETLEELTWPPELRDEITGSLVLTADADEVRDRLWTSFPEPRALDPVTEKSVTDLAWTFAADLSVAAVSERFLDTGDADLTMLYMALPDVAGHRFWCFHEPEAFHFEIEEPFRTDFAEYVALSYVEIDRLVGRVLDAAPADANVVLLSDHGMHAQDLDELTATSGHHPDGPPGVFAAMGPTVRPLGNLLDDRLGHVLEVAPFVLRLLEVPIPEHWPARTHSGLAQFLDEEWRRANEAIRGRNPDASFRPATPSRIPAEDLDTQFIEDFGALGYAVGRNAEHRDDAVRER